MKQLCMVLLAGSLSGCNFTPSAPSLCYVLLPSDTEPSGSFLVDQCTGRTWLLVRSRIGDKPTDGYTYNWFKLDRYDNSTPTLASQ